MIGGHRVLEVVASVFGPGLLSSTQYACVSLPKESRQDFQEFLLDA